MHHKDFVFQQLTGFGGASECFLMRELKQMKSALEVQTKSN